MEYYWHPCMFRDPRTVQESPNIFVFVQSLGRSVEFRGSLFTVIMSSVQIYFGVVKVFDESGTIVGGNNSRKYPFPKHHDSPPKRTLCIFIDLEESDIFPIEAPR